MQGVQWKFAKWIPVDVIVAPSFHLVKRAPLDAPWPGVPGMPGSMGGNTPVGVPMMGGHMTEQMEDQIRNMMEQVLMPFQEQVMSKLCSVEENLQRRLDGVLATYDAIDIHIYNYIYTYKYYIYII